MKIQIFSDTDQMKLMSQSIPTSIIPPSLNIKLIKFCFLAIFCCLAGIAYTVCIIKVDVKKLGNKCLEMDRQYRHKLNHTLNELEKFRNHSKIDSKEPTYDDLLQYYRAKHNRPTLTDASCTMDDQSRYDCDPSPNSSKQQCLLLGCCWKQPNHKVSSYDSLSHDKDVPLAEPWCFFPNTYLGYDITSQKNSADGLTLELTRRSPSSFNDEIKLLVNIEEISTNILNVAISKLASTEPLLLPKPLNTESLKKNRNRDSSGNNYNYQVINGTISVFRKDNGVLIWSANLHTMIFAEQFRQLDTIVPVPALYGLGERMDHYQKTEFNYTRYTFFNRDRIPWWKLNLYGSHPMYLITEDDGKAHSVLFANSYPAEAILRPGPAVTWRALGGDLNFFLIVEQNPIQTIVGYNQLVGTPVMPPVWALGFQLCRYGYNTLDELKATYQRMRDAKIPYDVQWNDIDVMDSFNDFTYDPVNFAGLPDFIDELHKNNMRYITMLDPGLEGTYLNGDKYPGFTVDTVVQNPDGTALRAKVWNHNWTAWIDFTSINANNFWIDQIIKFHGQIQFDGLWIDMNDPSNEVDGSLDGCVGNTLDFPPYLPGDDLNPIFKNTACMSARHSAGEHYQIHNLYSAFESQTTNVALTMLNKRPFIISRSSFIGSGQFSSHWTGDVVSSFEYLKQSVTGMMDFNLFGIPMVGADICGFNGNTTNELCARWQELGAFYPFSRNHNTNDGIPQDPPSLGPTVVTAARNSLLLRYQLHNLLYTLFYEASTSGSPVVNSLMMVFPNDPTARSIETQFLWGDSLMIMPVLDQGATSVNAYFPAGIWYDFPSYSQIVSGYSGTWKQLDAPLEVIRLAVRGGSILALQDAQVTIPETRQNSFTLVAFLDESATASGNLYWDDGETLNTSDYNLISFTVQNNVFTAKASLKGKVDQPNASTVTIVNVSEPQSVTLNGQSISFIWKDNQLTVNVDQSLQEDFTIQWQ